MGYRGAMKKAELLARGWTEDQLAEVKRLVRSDGLSVDDAIARVRPDRLGARSQTEPDRAQSINESQGDES